MSREGDSQPSDTTVISDQPVGMYKLFKISIAWLFFGNIPIH